MKLRKDDIPAMRREYDLQNLESAHLIAAEPERYPGAMQDWAARVAERLKDFVPPRRVRKGQGRMFS